MSPPISLTAIAFFINTAFAFGFAILVWLRRDIAGRRVFAGLLFAIGGWTLARGLQIGAETPELHLFLSKIVHLSVVFTVSFWLLFALIYSQRSAWIKLHKIGWVWILPIITTLIALTNEWHGLVWSDIIPDGSGIHYGNFSYRLGPVFWINMVYADILILVGAYLFIRTVLDFPSKFRLQIGLLVTGTLVPMVANVLYVAGFQPLPSMDITPFGFILAALIYWYIITRTGLFDIIPIAREAIFSHLKDGVLVLDTQDRIVSANPAAQRLLLHPIEWLTGKKVNEVLAKGAELLQSPLESEVLTEIHWDEPAGEQEVTISPLKDRGGNTTGRLIVFRDITARKQAEIALRDSEVLYHNLVETLPLSIFRKDWQGYYTFANQRYCRGLGKTLPDIIGKQDRDLHPPDLAELYQDADLQIMTSGRGYETVEEHSLDDGTRAYVQVVKAPIYDAAGHIVGVQGLLWDITAAKQAEDAVRASTQRLASMVEMVPDGITILDPDGNIIFANPTAERLLGLTHSQIIGRAYNAPEWHIMTVDGIPFPAEELPFERVKRTGRPVYGVEHAIQQPDGKLILLSINAAPLNEAGEEFQGIVAAIVDITERKRSEQALARNAREMSALYETSLAINSQTDLPALLRTITERAASLLDSKIGWLYLVKPEAQILELVVNYNLTGAAIGTQLHFGDGIAGRVAQSGEPLMVEDYLRWPAKAAPFTDLKLRRVLAVPLKAQNKVIGVLSIADEQLAVPFMPEEIRLMSLFADQAAIAVDNTRLLDETTQHANQLAMLNRIGLAIAGGLDMDTVLRTLLEQCQGVAQVDCFYVSLYDQANELITVPFYYEAGQVSAGISRDIQQNPGLTGEVIRSRQTLYLDDTFESEYPTPTRMLHPESRETRSYIGLPLILRDKVIGVLSILSYKTDAYNQQQIHIMEMIAIQAAIAIENARLYSEVQRLSIVDELTGVYNYRGLLELGSREVERARRFRRPLSAFFFDIDDFRNFNNRYSHAIGNLVLRAVAQRSRTIVRAVDLVARYGGEEFVILLPEVSLHAAAQVAERLRIDIDRHRVATTRGELGVTVSIGVATLGDKANNLAALMDRANQAEHTAKETGKNRVSVIE
jgi:diguanylate cyclase (GGDEF)-like protein/PAS domain S-box-containing protein